ncbi:MAG: BCD family MFS transporter [Halieaceae bacterium]|jgi:BCD family chlorophyll transporter-like MFS transporter
MMISGQRFLSAVQGIGSRWLPFADAVSDELALGRLLRLSMFQISVAMAAVLLSGTLNRIMVVELGQPAWLVALMVAIPLLLAPARALVGFRSDYHKSYLGWRRVPYLWFGTLLQFGGLAIMPFALIVMTEPHSGPAITGPVAAMLAFVLVGAGMHTTQTAGLALATDLANEESRPKVVALLYVMLLVGTVAASLGFAQLLVDFTYYQLIQVLQGAAALTALLNFVALWKQEPRQPHLTRHDRTIPPFMEVWREFSRQPRARRLLVAIALGTMGFTMQDILLEPYGAQILAMTVSETTQLTALLGGGMLLAFFAAAQLLGRGSDPIRLAGFGVMVGVFAFSSVIFAAPFGSELIFRAGTFGIGLGNGLFAVGTLTAVMTLERNDLTGLALGAWGAVQTTATGIAIFAGGALRDIVAVWIDAGLLGAVLTEQSMAYAVVYHVEILILFIALIALGPLVRQPDELNEQPPGMRLADFPG